MASPLASVALRRRAHHFIVGSTGSGKSTFGAALLDQYHRSYPSDSVYFIDPKHRFVGVELEPEDRTSSLFPDGYREVRHGRRDGVSVDGRVISRPRLATGTPTEGLILQEPAAINETLTWLYHHSSVEHPAMLFFDETAQQMAHNRATGPVRLILQQGREIGIGSCIVHQTARWVDMTFLSETQALYIGSLYDPRDREKLYDACEGTPLRKHLLSPMPRYRWLYVDRVHWERSKIFDLDIS